MKVAIVGFGIEGRASYSYYQKLGANLTICDRQKINDLPKNTKVKLGNDWNKNLDQFDVIVRTAGINSKLLTDENPGIESKITTTISEFLRVCTSKNIIGVTGTKGKGTTSTLISKIIEEHGKKVLLAGNIGRSPIEYIDKITAETWVVLELSSFQLSDIQYAPHIMVCLMVEPEHLDWHDDTADYYQAKSRVFALQNRDDIAIYFAGNNNSKQIASNSRGHKIPFFTPPGAYIDNNNVIIDDKIICQTSEIKLLGKHNWQNVCAAITAGWQAGFRDERKIHSVITTFSGLPFRLEKIRELRGVTYFNDSLGTTPETTEAAIKSFSQPIVLIVGGSDKGISFCKLAETIANSTVRSIIAIGVTGPWIAKEVKKLNLDIDIVENLTKMDSMVNKAEQLAKAGDVVLLSCGSASFGLFKDYKDRGNQFNQAVEALS